MKNGYGMILRTNMVSRTGGNYIRVRVPVREEMKIWYWKILRANIVPVREEMKNGYEKILRANIVSRTGKKCKTGMG